MIKHLRQIVLGFSVMAASALTAQINIEKGVPNRTCATPIPGAEWDAWFNQQVEAYKASHINGKTAMPSYVIPVVFHVIHGGQAVGTHPNLSIAQITTQVTVLNNDFAGTGQNVANCPAAFQPVIASSGISFCLAVKDPTNGIMPDPGIHRVNFNTFTLSGTFTNKDPAGNAAGFTNFINQIVKPQTIWDPTKYCNIWVTDQPPNGGLLGFATFPAGTTLPGVTGGGGATTDGCWLWTKATGSVGTLDPTYNLGRTATHEIGHWLGLRHVWGDGNCVNDFCNDIPPAEAAHYGCPSAPHHVNQCGAGQSPNGEQTMNFMDYTDDACMYMFSNDQKTRMLTAMSQGTYRNLLGTHGLCTAGPPPVPGPAVASFSFLSEPCSGRPINISNNSSGGPPPTFSWSVTPATTASFSPNSIVASPAVTFSVPGTYTVTLVATNSVAASTFSTVVTVTPCPKDPVCLDTLRAIRKLDTLTTYKAPINAGVGGCGASDNRGWLTGTNCYKDREKAQYFSAATYSDTPVPQINSLIVLFDTVGTKGNAGTQITSKIWGYSAISGAPTNSLIASKADSLGRITGSLTVSTNSISYVGVQPYTLPSKRLKIHKFNFSPPKLLPSNGFFASVEMPIFNTTDSLLIFSNTYANTGTDSSAWVMEFINNNWKRIKTKYGVSVKMGIIPIITCQPKAIGVSENTMLASNISVMPNPSEGVFNIVTSFEQSRDINIEIYNYLGQMIDRVEYNSVSTNVFTTDLSSRANGIYFLTVTSEGQKVTKKLIVAK